MSEMRVSRRSVTKALGLGGLALGAQARAGASVPAQAPAMKITRLETILVAARKLGINPKVMREVTVDVMELGSGETTRQPKP